MYHHQAVLQIKWVICLVCLTIFLCLPVLAEAPESYSPGVEKIADPVKTGQIAKFALIAAKRSRQKPEDMALFEYDAKPLGDRYPFLLVHGLRGEYCRHYRWEKVAKHLSADREFGQKFKIYFVRYDSTASLSKTVPQMRETISTLFERTNQRPIWVMALSIGGNLIYEAMNDPSTDQKVGLLFALGTPFHGSPLFSTNWLQYGMYKSLSMPWTSIDHAVAYRLYFAHNPNLLKDFSWDNADNAIPEVGRFQSRLPFGPRGVLTVDDSINKRFLALDRHVIDHNKVIAYCGYLVNPCFRPVAARLIENTITAPYTLLTVSVPAHFAREHPVLKMLNNAIAEVVTTPEAATRAKTPFVYELNDGITPVASALFLPREACARYSVSKESDMLNVRNYVDVRTARVFKNIDHLSFIDGYHPLGSAFPAMLRDELNPHAGARDLFSWMVFDINRSFKQSSVELSEEPGTLAKGANGEARRDND
jgi:hypothetical protein